MYDDILADIIKLDSNKLAKRFDMVLTGFEASVSCQNDRFAYYYFGQLKMMATINKEFYNNERFKEARRKAFKEAGYHMMGCPK